MRPAFPWSLALVALTMLLPGSAFADKADTRPKPCCSSYSQMKKRVRFSEFEETYEMVDFCGTGKKAIVFKIRKRGKLCADPKQKWTQKLMEHLDKVTNGQREASQNNRPEKHSAPSNATPGIGTSSGPSPTSGVPSPTPATTAHSETTGKAADSSGAQGGGSEDPSGPPQGEGAGIPTSEGQLRTDPSTPEGDPSAMRSRPTPGPSAPRPRTAVPRETTRGPDPTPPNGQQGGSEDPSGPPQGEGAGIPTSEGQLRTDPSTPEGDPSAMRSRPTAPSPRTAVPRETTRGPTPTPPSRQQGHGEFGESPPETPDPASGPAKDQSEGHTTVLPGMQHSPSGESARAGGQEGAVRPRMVLSNSKVAVLILVPITLFLLSVIAYLRCKKKGRGAAGPGYHMTAQETTEDVYDAL
uniref:proline-rich protein HaeIII subfamily 1-like isoform X2 n=1 Tax=Pristiophorus japonicus TaxID=55135 RepID=UPI00398EE1FC